MLPLGNVPEQANREQWIASDLTDLGAALSMVEEEHLRPLRPAVAAINAQFDGIIGLMPSVAKKAAVIAEHAEKR